MRGTPTTEHVVADRLCGTRDAAQAWEKEYTNTLLALGFVQGKASTCIFRHNDRNIDLVVHGDDFTALAEPEQIQWLRAGISEKYDIKFRGVLGPRPVNGEQQEITVLNRVVR